ncbi:MAG: CRISPR-associated protein Cas4 [Candidatus Micrarchaeota archaeon]|nr:CRISPR-associated protein Cas4 [Candidatus Micrarchaeota archaeon]
MNSSYELGGLLILYLNICERKLWFYTRGLRMENRSDLVLLGKIIDLSFYTRRKQEDDYTDDFIRTDFITHENGVIVHEIKKSDKLLDADVWQVKYYMYVLSKRGVNVPFGILHFPEKRKKITIILEEQDKQTIERMMQRIQEIKTMDKPPEINRKPFCKSCAYFELCWAGEKRGRRR